MWKNFCNCVAFLLEALGLWPTRPRSLANSHVRESQNLLQTTRSPAPHNLSVGANGNSNSLTGRPAPLYTSAAYAQLARGQPSSRPVASPRLSGVEMNPMDADIDLLLQSVDFFIRTRNRFDSRTPLSYSIPLTTIASDASLVNEFCDLLKDFPELPYHNLRSLIDSPAGRTKFDLTTRSVDVYVSVRYLTPMQVASTHRLFGYFQCGDDGCRNTWTSAASWTNKWQQCKRCESTCYPYDQHVLQKSETPDDSGLRPHHMARCERCQELGRICYPSRYYAA